MGKQFKPRFLALFLIALLAACSGGTPNLQTSPQMGMPQSISPARVPAAPMAKTAILPASAMRASGVTTQSAIQSASYTQIPGAGTFAAAAPDGSLWVLSTAPAGADKSIWHYANGSWTNISGLASRLAVAPNGTLYAINSGGGIYSYNLGTWTGYGGGASDITIGSDGSIYVLSNGNAPGSDQAIWHNLNGGWIQIPGQGIHIAASWDTNNYEINGGAVNAGGIYIVNSIGGIYYENTNNTITQIPGSASAIVATTVGGIFVLNYPASASGNTVYYYDLNTPGWTTQGAGINISTDSNKLYVISSSNAIFYTYLQDPGFVNLRSAASFAILAGSTVTSTGPTRITGDVGIFPGTAITGFGPGTINGILYAGGPTAQQAEQDLTRAFNDAVARANSPISVSGNLGGLTLTPGLYKSTSSLAISSGDLTLDARGNSNGIFIIQMASTFTMTTGRMVILTNGAKAGNIFWAVGSSATLGTGCTFMGNLLVSQSISALTGTAITGRLLTQVGAVTMDSDTIVKPPAP
jgi:hypothetical protein